MGQWTYQYDSSGKLISQTNANGQQAVVEYDALGQMIGRIAVDGETNWLYVLFDNSLSLSFAKIKTTD
jgi:YD repeat-containing protein